MPELLIDGVAVDFPYEPYDSQRDYMKCVIACLKNVRYNSSLPLLLQRWHGVLESPTGTGKTLSLLCATLGYIRHIRRTERSALAHTSSTRSANEGSEKSADDILDAILLGNTRVYYTSRTHSQLSQVVRELNKTTYARDIKMCVLGSRDQLCINENVKQLTSSNAKNQTCRQYKSSRRCPFYNEYERRKGDDITKGRMGKEKGGKLPGAWQTDDVAVDEGVEELINDMKAADIEDIVSYGKRERICPYFHTRDRLDTADLVLLPYNYVLDPVVRNANKLKFANSIVIFDEGHNLSSFCEDASSVSLRSRDVAGALREAKQVLQMITEATEEKRTVGDNATCAFGALAVDEEKPDFDIEPTELVHLTLMLETLDSEMREIGLDRPPTTATHFDRGLEKGSVQPAVFMQQLLAKCDIRQEHAQPILHLIDKCAAVLTEKHGDIGRAFMTKGASLQKFGAMLAAIHLNGEMDNKDLEHFSVYITDDESKTAKSTELSIEDYMPKTGNDKGIVINYWCFTARIGMRFLEKHADHRARSVIVTSGTLSPMRPFIHELGIPISVQLENEHVVKSSQVWLGVVARGPAGIVLDSTFRNRGNDDYLHDLALSIVSIVSQVPQGVLLFFASYAQMNACVESWKVGGVLYVEYTQYMQAGGEFARIHACKHVVVEPRQQSAFVEIMREFDDRVAREPRGAMLMAVCRGKVSEGIDFADFHARAVVMVGIPYPPLLDARVALKKMYLQRTAAAGGDKKISADEWYQLEATRAVSQAVGRVIRHRSDYGVVILADVRYASWPEKRLPRWLTRRPANVLVHQKTFVDELHKFFNSHDGYTRAMTSVSTARKTFETFESSFVGEQSTENKPRLPRGDAVQVKEEEDMLDYDMLEELKRDARESIQRRRGDEGEGRRKVNYRPAPRPTGSLLQYMERDESSTIRSSVAPPPPLLQRSRPASNTSSVGETQPRKRIKLKANTSKPLAQVQPPTVPEEEKQKTDKLKTLLADLMSSASSAERQSLRQAIVAEKTAGDILPLIAVFDGLLALGKIDRNIVRRFEAVLSSKSRMAFHNHFSK